MSEYRKIKVEDLLNDVPARGKISHRPTPVQSDIFRFICRIDNCNRRFATSKALLAHQRRTHAPPTPFMCSKCHSTFSSRANLTKHVLSVHNKVKPFKCQLCSSSFGFKDGLERHMKMVHEQARPFVCDHCVLKFKSKSHLTNHLLAIHPEELEKKSNKEEK